MTTATRLPKKEAMEIALALFERVEQIGHKNSQLQDQLAEHAVKCTSCSDIPENKGKRVRCNLCEAAPVYCMRHWRRHIAVSHGNHSVSDTERSKVTKAYMGKGLIAAYNTTTNSTVREREMVDPFQSPLIKMAEYAGIPEPATLHIYRPEYDRDQIGNQVKTENTRAMLEDFLYQTGMKVYAGHKGGNITLLVGKESDIDFLPEDMKVPMAEQISASGVVFNAASPTGKLVTRVRGILGETEGAHLYSRRPSDYSKDFNYGVLRLGDTRRVPFTVWDTNGAGDGGGCVKKSTAKRICRAFGVAYHPSMKYLYTYFTLSDSSVKAQLYIIDDERFPTKDPQGREMRDIDMIIDTEDVKKDLGNNQVTMGRLIPRRIRHQSPWTVVDTLNQLSSIQNFLDMQEVIRMTSTIVAEAGRDTWKHALNGQEIHDDEEEANPASVMLEMMNQENALSEADEEKSNNKRLEKDRATMAREASGGSIFANTSVLDREISRVSQKIAGEMARKKPMPAVIVSGGKFFLVHPRHAGVTMPRPGYIRIVWEGDIIVGVGLDLSKAKWRLDTPDCDGDTVTVIFTVDDHGQHGALVLRSPSSFDAGVHLKVNLEDARRLRKLGYHFYNRVGDHQYPDLYELDKEGNPIHPDALNATPYDPPIPWHPAGMDLVDTLLTMCLDQKSLGSLCNALWALAWAGLFDVERLKFNYSEAGVDANFNCTGNPWQVVEPLWEELLHHIKRGIPMEACLWPRIEAPLKELHERQQKHLEEQGEVSSEFPKVKFKCYGPHQAKHAAVKKAHRDQLERDRRHLLLGTSPAQRLTQDHDPKLVEEVVAAHYRRNALWGSAMDEKREIEENREYNFREKAKMIDRLFLGAKATEKRVIRQAQERAAKNPEYRHGDFTSLWIQLSASRKRRYEGQEGGPPVPQPVSTHTLFSSITEEELYGYYAGVTAGPTALVRTTGPRCELPEGTPVRIEQKRPSIYALVNSEDGADICNVKYDARVYAGLKLEVAGYIPDLTPKKEEVTDEKPKARRNQGPPPHRQEPDILVLNVRSEGLESY